MGASGWAVHLVDGFPGPVCHFRRDSKVFRAKRLAEALGVSENRLYSELIHDGLKIPYESLLSQAA